MMPKTARESQSIGRAHHGPNPGRAQDDGLTSMLFAHMLGSNQFRQDFLHETDEAPGAARGRV
jgi:hypothetical protein